MIDVNSLAIGFLLGFFIGVAIGFTIGTRFASLSFWEMLPTGLLVIMPLCGAVFTLWWYFRTGIFPNFELLTSPLSPRNAVLLEESIKISLSSGLTLAISIFSGYKKERKHQEKIAEERRIAEEKIAEERRIAEIERNKSWWTKLWE